MTRRAYRPERVRKSVLRNSKELAAGNGPGRGVRSPPVNAGPDYTGTRGIFGAERRGRKRRQSLYELCWGQQRPQGGEGFSGRHRRATGVGRPRAIEIRLSLAGSDGFR